MRVIPLAAESLGVRSMATYVEVADTAILIDPGATLAPARYGLPPAEAEWEALRRANGADIAPADLGWIGAGCSIDQSAVDQRAAARAGRLSHRQREVIGLACRRDLAMTGEDALH